MLVRGAVIAGLYAALTLVLWFASFGPVQFRISEALCVLPYFLPEAIPGLYIGCIISNIFSPINLVLDLTVGAGATLLAALITYHVRIKWLAPLPPIILNAVIVGWELAFTYSSGAAFWPSFGWNALTVGLGEASVCYVLGLPLLLLLERSGVFAAARRRKIFSKSS